MPRQINMARRDQTRNTLTRVRHAVEYGPPQAAARLGEFLGVPADAALDNARARADALIAQDDWPQLRAYLAKLREWAKSLG